MAPSTDKHRTSLPPYHGELVFVNGLDLDDALALHNSLVTPAPEPRS